MLFLSVAIWTFFANFAGSVPSAGSRCTAGTNDVINTMTIKLHFFLPHSTDISHSSQFLPVFASIASVDCDRLRMLERLKLQRTRLIRGDRDFICKQRCVSTGETTFRHQSAKFECDARANWRIKWKSRLIFATRVDCACDQLRANKSYISI